METGTGHHGHHEEKQYHRHQHHHAVTAWLMKRDHHNEAIAAKPGLRRVMMAVSIDDGDGAAIKVILKIGYFCRRK